MLATSTGTLSQHLEVIDEGMGWDFVCISLQRKQYSGFNGASFMPTCGGGVKK
jgi:hypothetical protein